METIEASVEEKQLAFASAKKEEIVKKQKLNVRYHVEDYQVSDRVRNFLEAFAVILKHSNYRFLLEHFIRVSAKCARCTVQCPIYLATHDPKDIPCYRSELLLQVYRRHFTLAGDFKGRLFGSGCLTDDLIEEMAESFWNCTACRRCTIECPAGIDHALITHLGRFILSEIGIAPRALVVSTREQLEGKTGNTSAIPLPAMVDSLEFLEEEIEDEKGIKVKFLLDVEGAEYMFIPAVSDFLMEADTLMGIAVVFHATGGSWTIGTKYFDAINYGLFYSDRILERVIKKLHDEAKRLKVKGIIIGECGHASRTAKYFVPTFCDGKNSLPVYNIMEYTYKMMREGKIKFDNSVIDELVTYHDPCNIARQGWVVDQPREIIKAFCKNFTEMTPKREDNICCGGGGGTVSIDEIRPYRTLIGGKAKAEQIKKTGAKYLIAPCANCKKQLRELVEDQKIDCEVVGLHDLIYKAIILNPEKVEDKKLNTKG
jgi:Fe-S oxidoreductase